MIWVIIQTIILAITAVVVGIYTVETQKLRKESKKQTEIFQNQTKSLRDANTFAAITRVHERLSNVTSYRVRRYLLNEFPAILSKVTEVALKKKYNVNQFNEMLMSKPTPVDGINARDAVELTLLDFDIIALPFSMRIESTREVAKAYKTVLETTAQVISSFVEIQMKLRGDPNYKIHYRNLLEELPNI